MVWVDLVNSKLQHFMRVRRVGTEQLSCETYNDSVEDDVHLDENLTVGNC